MFTIMNFRNNCKLITLIVILFSNGILSFPFEFPKSGISFSSSDESDEFKDIQRCLNEEDYSMPFFDPKTRDVSYLKLSHNIYLDSLIL